ncbi:MAG TPA: M48 family metallopeptidase [Candidatus Binatia bacterium]|nr:M48 family metallopeptidase [Candidatus Binatia bacterium]
MKRAAALLGLVVLLGACAAPSSAPPAGSPRTEAPRPGRTTAQVDPAQAERLRRLMVPLIRAMDNPPPLDKVKVGVVADPRVNAGNAGGGQFFVTTGLLEKANDDQLQAVLAHEVAHEDLGHVAKAQALGAGLNIGMIILDQILPGSGAITPIAGELIFRSYTRREEYAADAHGVTLLERVGKSRQQMIDTLTWLMRTEGGASGGFFSTHPATGDRIEALQRGR